MQAHLRAGQDVKFRDSYAPLPSCRVSQFLAASFARNRRFRDFLKFGTFGGCASGERAVLRVLSEYSLPLTFTLNGRPSGPACCFVFGYRLGTGVPPWGPPPHLGPAVHSDGWTALHIAAAYGNRRIVGLLVESGADVNTQEFGGCAVSVAAIGGVRRPSPRHRRPCRLTPLHFAASNGNSDAIAELLLRGADGAVQDYYGYRCARRTADRTETAPRARAQAHAEARRGR